MKQFRIGNNGFSLVETLISLAVFLVVVLGFVRYTASSFQGMGYLNLKGQLEQVRNQIRAELNCEETLAVNMPSCPIVPNETFVSLMRRDGLPIIEVSGTIITGYEMRVRCMRTGNYFRFTVEAKRSQNLSAGLTGVVASDWIDLFGGVPLTCRG